MNITTQFFTYDLNQNRALILCKNICCPIISRIRASIAIPIDLIANYFSNAKTYYITRKILYIHNANESTATKAAVIFQTRWRIQIRKKEKKNETTLSKCIDHLVLAKDREGLKFLSYCLFSENKSFLEIYSNHAHILMQLFEDPEAYLSDIGLVILKTFEEYKAHQLFLENYPYSEKEKASLAFEKAQLESNERQYWGETRKQDPNQVIQISHGGGFRHIQEFMKGQSRGYPLANRGRGIQVSPINLGRDGLYSLRASKHFDQPAVLQAEIQAKYLDNAPADYEAGLRPEYVKYLQNIEVKKMQVSQRDIYRSFPDYINWEKAEKDYTKSQLKRLKLTVDRLKIKNR